MKKNHDRALYWSYLKNESLPWEMCSSTDFDHHSKIPYAVFTTLLFQKYVLIKTRYRFVFPIYA